MLLHRRFTLRSLALLLLFFSSLSVLPARAADGECFPETGQCLDGRFSAYWHAQGGLPVFGFPIAAVGDEPNRDTGASYPTQWLERNRFEYHAELPAPYTILLGRLGDDRLRQLGVVWQNTPRDAGPQAGCRWFAETSLNICDQGSGVGFRRYWETHGLNDSRLSAYQRSLALFGLPLTQARMETNSSGDTVLTQWFERARFEWHPGQPDQFKVLLGRLGAETRQPATPAPAGRLVYVSAADIFAGGDLYVMNADGSGQRRLTNTNAIPLEGSEFAVSPAGDRVAYRAGSSLYVIGLDGSGQQLVATTAQGEPLPPILFEPTWAPDGSYLAFVREGGVYTWRPGQAPAKLTDASSPACLSWARNGYLSFRQPAMHTFKLFVIRSDGADSHQIAWGLCGTLSPAGDRMVYLNGMDLGLVNFDGTNDHMLTTGLALGRPQWSPDGTRLIATVFNSSNPYDQDVALIDATTGAVRRLTTDPNLDSMASWSPDGRFVAFASKRALRYGVYRMAADGSGQTLLATPQEAAAPQWVP